MSEKEEVHHPNHYGGDSTYEAIKVIEAWEAGFNTGNALKYICRAESKGKRDQDYQKACWYLLRELAIHEKKDPNFYNDIVKGMAIKGAVRVKTATAEEIEAMRAQARAQAQIASLECASCHPEPAPQGQCHDCGRRWGGCTPPCDAMDCESDSNGEYEAFNLCSGHLDLAPCMPAAIFDQMRVAKNKPREGPGGARGLLAKARGHFVEAGEQFAEAGAGFKKKIYVLEQELVATRAEAFRFDREIARLKSQARDEAMDNARELDQAGEKIKEAHARVPHEVDLALFRSSEIVEKAYGRCRAWAQIRRMGSEALRIKPMAPGEAVSVSHSESVKAQAAAEVIREGARCKRCLAKLVTSVHNCLAMEVPSDHYVSFLEKALQAKTDQAGTPQFVPVGEAPGFAEWWAGPRPPVATADFAQGTHANAFAAGADYATRENAQTQHQVRIEKMMKGFGQEVPGKPLQVAPDELRVLRARLIMEECLETVQDGLRIEITDRCGGVIDFKGLGFDALPGPVNLVELADGVADVSVVSIGTLSAFGIKDGALLREVDANNQGKIDTGRTDEHGKFVKHPDHRPPDIAGVLSAQGWGYQGQAAAMDKSPFILD